MGDICVVRILTHDGKIVDLYHFDDIQTAKKYVDFFLENVNSTNYSFNRFKYCESIWIDIPIIYKVFDLKFKHDEFLYKRIYEHDRKVSEERTIKVGEWSGPYDE